MTAAPQDALRRLFGRGSVYTVALAVQMSTALLVVPVVTRLLSAERFGEVAAALVVLSIVSIAGAFGLPEGASKLWFSGAAGPRRARRLVVATLATALAAATLAELTAPLWAGVFGIEPGGALRWGIWGGAATSVLLAAQALLRAADRVWAFLAAAVTATVGGQALGLALAAATGSPAGYVGGIAGGAAFGAALGLVLTGALRHGLPPREDLRAGLAVGLPLVPHSLAVYGLNSADRVAIAAVLGLGAVGRYQVAYALGGLGIALVTALNQAWLPLLLGTPEHERTSTLALTARAVHRLTVAVAGVLALTAPVLLVLAAPASYDREALVSVTAVVALGIVPFATSVAYGNVLFVAGRTRVMAVAAPAAAVANLALNFALLPVLGLAGAALATVAAYGIMAAVVARAALRLGTLPAPLDVAPLAWAAAVPLALAGALLPTDAAGLTLRAGLLAALGAAATRVVQLGLRRARPSLPSPATRPLEEAPA